MKSSYSFHLPQDLPTTTALALFNFLNEIADAVWLQYESEIVEGIFEEFDMPPSSPIELPFDDDIEF